MLENRRSPLRYPAAAFVAFLVIVLFLRNWDSSITTTTTAESNNADEPQISIEYPPSSKHDPPDLAHLASGDDGTAAAKTYVSSSPAALKDTEEEGDTMDRHRNHQFLYALKNGPETIRNGPELHAVIAHHSENPLLIKAWTDSLRSIPYARQLGTKVIIYTKGLSSQTDISALQNDTGADSVISLPNIGREGSIYLHHILDHYHNPPAYTLFAQAEPQAAQIESGPRMGALQDWLMDRLKRRFTSTTAFMSLASHHDIGRCGYYTDMSPQGHIYPLWPQLYALIEGNVCAKNQTQVTTYHGHFIVSRQRILARPRKLYKHLQELVNAPEDHWIHGEQDPTWFEQHKGPSKPSNPKFGHTLERLWHTMFGCGDPAEVVDCDVSGGFGVQGPGGCSCVEVS